MNKQEALAESWASIDGKLDEFRAGKGQPEEAHGGHYGGYMAEAEEMIKRLEKRGFAVIRLVRRSRVSFTLDES